MMVATRPFDDNGTEGNFAFWWEKRKQTGEFCVSDNDLRTWADDAVRKVFATGTFRHFKAAYDQDPADFRCVAE